MDGSASALGERESATCKSLSWYWTLLEVWGLELNGVQSTSTSINWGPMLK